MPVTQMDSLLADAVGRFGAVIGDSLTGGPRKRREEELRGDPDRLARLIPHARAAQRAGRIAEFSQTLGVSPEFAEGIATNLEPSLQQQIEEKFIAGGGVDLTVERNLQGLATEMQKMTFDADYLSRAMDAGLPGLQVLSQASGFTYDVKNNTYRSELIDIDLTTGLPQMRANEEAMKLKIGIAAYEAYESYIEGLPDTPAGNHFRTMATLAIANPGYAGHMQFHESLDFQNAARLASSTTSMEDQLGVYTKWRTAMNDALDRAQEAKEDGDNELELAAVRDVEGMVMMGQSLINAGAMPPVELTSAEFEEKWLFKDRLVTFGVKPELVDPLARAAQEVVSGVKTMEQLKNSPAFQSMTEENQTKLLATILGGTGEDTFPSSAPEAGAAAGRSGGFFSHFDHAVKDLGVGPALGYAASTTITGLGIAWQRVAGKGYQGPSYTDIYNNMLSDRAKEMLDNPGHASIPASRGRHN